MAQRLDESGVEYAYLGDSLGGRPKDPTWYKTGEVPQGKANYLELVDYLEVARRPWYQAGIKRLLAFAEESRVAAMCSEEDPSRCHRHHLVSQTLLSWARPCGTFAVPAPSNEP